MADTEIVKAEKTPVPHDDMFVFARNPKEMVKAQERQVAFFDAKVALEKERKEDLEHNLELAKKNKWRTETLKRHVGFAQDRIDFFEKIRDAVKAGYCIVPDMDIDVFAIRTTAKVRENRVTSELRWGSGSFPKEQRTNSPPAGEGEYVSPAADSTELQGEKPPQKEGEKPTPIVTRWATEHGKIEFPFQLARAEVLEVTAHALSQKLFDEVGILPRRRGADPMVVGRISLKGRKDWNRKSVNFVIAWFLDLSDF